MITDRQVRLLSQKRMEGKTQETAAAKAGMSVRSARKWQSGPLPSQAKPEHRWRTRPDPFDGVWEDEIEPLLEVWPETRFSPSRRFLNVDCRCNSGFLKRIAYTTMPYKTGLRLLGVARNPANGFPARLLVLQRRFLNLVSFWQEIASRKPKSQSCQARGQAAMERCSRPLSCEASL